MSEIVERSGVPVATVKYYLREGLLPPGESTGATSALYGEDHVRRLALIRALTDVVGLSVAKTKVVLGLIDSPRTDLYVTLGEAVAALPPYAQDDVEDLARARSAIETLGWLYDPSYPAVAQLERALAAAESVGMPMSAERLRGYGEHLRAIAQIDIAQVPSGDAKAAIQYAVLGTALYEPILAALRRLAHQDVSSSELGARPGGA
ncbi:MerR family transcriptional regulator [Arthrobacter sp.]|uniref:MerR family transcriptional regulator n=1 Tax=Arthrobacter sp. TaxID=1667 RepID=UPI00281150E5|nr:MerR family transcriptional regulator [Arthrobacter sp.]